MKSQKLNIDSMQYMVVPMQEYLRLLALDDKNKVTRADICNLLGIKKSTLSHQPWLIPNYDIPSKGVRGYKWDREVWEEWNKIPVSKRRDDYRRKVGEM